MKKMCALFLFLTVAAGTVALPRAAPAQGTREVSVVALDSETFVTVQQTGTGESISLFRIRSGRIVLVDTVFSSGARDPDLPKRYLHHQEVENR
ncbi:MAG: hypothetical protein JSV00_09995 [bacterium]|nr:MAG: hypothetical protein JSV00_09995 [bacterium]